MNSGCFQFHSPRKDNGTRPPMSGGSQDVTVLVPSHTPLKPNSSSLSNHYDTSSNDDADLPLGGSAYSLRNRLESMSSETQTVNNHHSQDSNHAHLAADARRHMVRSPVKQHVLHSDATYPAATHALGLDTFGVGNGSLNRGPSNSPPSYASLLARSPSGGVSPGSPQNRGVFTQPVRSTPNHQGRSHHTSPRDRKLPDSGSVGDGVQYSESSVSSGERMPRVSGGDTIRSGVRGAYKTSDRHVSVVCTPEAGTLRGVAKGCRDTNEARTAVQQTGELDDKQNEKEGLVYGVGVAV